MSPDLPPEAPPKDLPVRPYAGDPVRNRLVVAFVLVTVIAVVLGVLAVASLLREQADLVAAGPASPTSSASVTATPSPTSTLPPRAQAVGAFRFLETAAGGDPVRWNPCDTITYAVNTAGASEPVRPDLKEALRRVTAATGIHFRSVGTTRETFLRAYQRMRYDGVNRKAELILIWVDDGDYQQILRQIRDRRPSIAFAKTMAGLYADRDQFFGGIIVIDDDATSYRGFGYTHAHGSVLLHELGHIMGLDHVKDPDQLMYSGWHPNYGLGDFSSGDLEGLRRLGEGAGCLD